MRITGGELRGRNLAVPPGARPTEGRVREALFSMWSGRLEGARVLDLFAGSGAVGLEAASRGAGRVVLIEKARPALAAARANIAHLGEGHRATLRPGDACRLGRATEPFDIVFVDPPYRSGLATAALGSLVRGGWLAPDARVVVELGAAEPLPGHKGLSVEDTRRYGAARLLFLRPTGPRDDEQAGDGGEAAAVVAGGAGTLQP
jgi:16S rRNA (guanine966-N2)-methyltransferase